MSSQAGPEHRSCDTKVRMKPLSFHAHSLQKPTPSPVWASFGIIPTHNFHNSRESIMNKSLCIPDKTGRPVHIHKPHWKISAYQRDCIYQRFLQKFPDKNWRSTKARDWMCLQAEQYGLSSSRVRDFIGEACKAEIGKSDKSWKWWVDCSLIPGAKETEP